VSAETESEILYVQLLNIFACRCVAENSAGRSEVTFKAWFNPAEDDRSSDDQPATGVVGDGGSSDATESKLEVVVGASLSAAAVILVAVASCVVFVLRRRQPCHRKYAYYVRNNHDSGAAKPPSTHALRRLIVRGRRLFRVASLVEDPKDGEDTVGGCDMVDDDDDKIVSSTLQSLLEAKQLFDDSLPRRMTTDDEDTEKGRLEHDELLHTEHQLDGTKEESDVDRCPCSCADHDVAADDSASKTDSEQTGQDEVKEPAPDLLTGDGHTFRRGGVARSPYRRSKPKVSFADYRSPSSDFTSGDSTSSQTSSTPRRQAVTPDDGVDSVNSSVVRGLSRHSCFVVDLSDSSPTCSSKDETSRTGVGSVHRSRSSNAVAASKVPPPPMSLLRTTQERRRQTATTAGGHNELDVGTVNIALPATISGVTEGLFPPTKCGQTYQRRTGGECCVRLGPRLSEPTIRRAPRNKPPRAVSHGTEV